MSIIRNKKKEIKTHKELVAMGYNWMLRTKQRNCLNMYSSCSIAFKEIVSCNREIPDVLGFNMHTSILIECKSNRNDFLSDKKKDFRVNTEKGMGEYRFYLVNEGVVNENDDIQGWGLLVAKNRSIRILKDSARFKYNLKYENRFLISLLRRISFFNLLDILNDTKMKPLQFEYDIDEVDEVFGKGGE